MAYLFLKTKFVFNIIETNPLQQFNFVYQNYVNGSGN